MANWTELKCIYEVHIERMNFLRLKYLQDQLQVVKHIERRESNYICTVKLIGRVGTN